MNNHTTPDFRGNDGILFKHRVYIEKSSLIKKEGFIFFTKAPRESRGMIKQIFGLGKQMMEFKTFLKHFCHFLNGFWVS